MLVYETCAEPEMERIQNSLKHQSLMPQTPPSTPIK